jgi:hypothetical protein
VIVLHFSARGHGLAWHRAQPAAGDTDPGLRRGQNEDRFFFDGEGRHCW